MAASVSRYAQRLIQVFGEIAFSEFTGFSDHPDRCVITFRSNMDRPGGSIVQNLKEAALAFELNRRRSQDVHTIVNCTTLAMSIFVSACLHRLRIANK